MTQAQAVLDIGFAALLDTHGEPATYYPAGGYPPGVDAESSTVTVIFDEDSVVIDPETMTSSLAPRAMTWTSDIPTARNGDRLELRGTVYNVLHAKVDGVGMTALTLSRGIQVPLAPSSLGVELIDGQAVLSWTRNATNNSAVEVWHDDRSGWALLATLAAGVTTYTHTASMSNGYKVRNTNQSGPSPFSYIFNTSLWGLTDEAGILIGDESGNVIGGPV